MSYKSIDVLQKALTKNIFNYAKDPKKAAGRALGTIVEIISFYLLKSWGLEHSTAIEKRLVEFGESGITHNVEYSLHPIVSKEDIELKSKELPISTAKIIRNCVKTKAKVESIGKKTNTLLSTDGILRNSCVIADNGENRIVAFLKSYSDEEAKIVAVEQSSKAFAMIECKRVGIEEGNKKGPQTIEKAKQGAYVANTVSSLQKIRGNDGATYGAMPLGNGNFKIELYSDFLAEIVESKDSNLLRNFILTVGIVSNHGNWFTSDNPNKELKVLKHAYDWLVFLSDSGLAEFIEDLILNPATGQEHIQAAFKASYTGTSGNNQFTKVKMNLEADRQLQSYFTQNQNKILKWFSVLSPEKKLIGDLNSQLAKLCQKKWSTIL